MYGDNGDNIIDGGAGDDTIRGADGNDTIDGGAGTDTLDYSAAASGVTVNLTTGTASNDGDGGSDTLSNLENVIGSAFADTITGGSATGTLTGGAGDDTITSGSTDTLTAQVNAILAANSGVVYNSTTGSFYKYVNSNVTWSAANTAASGTSINGVAGHLVHSTTSTENSYIDTLAGTTDVWAGMNDSATEGTWLFIGGVLGGLQFWQGAAAGSAQNGFYTNWATNQPNNQGGGAGSDFLTIENGGQWDDVAGTGRAKQSYVIEWEGSQLLTPTSVTTLAGGDGLDSLYGAAGQDIFLFEAATAYNNIDRIYNYNFAHLDKIDIGDLLSGYTAGSSDDDLFARFVVSGADLLLQVDANGATGGSSYTSVAQLMGAATSGLNIEEMVANGLLVMT